MHYIITQLIILSLIKARCFIASITTTPPVMVEVVGSSFGTMNVCTTSWKVVAADNVSEWKTALHILQTQFTKTDFTQTHIHCGGGQRHFGVTFTHHRLSAALHTHSLASLVICSRTTWHGDRERERKKEHEKWEEGCRERKKETGRQNKKEEQRRQRTKTNGGRRWAEREKEM